MAKNDAPAPAAPAVPAGPPVLGTQIVVRMPEGGRLINNETGAWFVPGADTPQTVTTTTLRRLADLDLVQVG